MIKKSVTFGALVAAAMLAVTAVTAVPAAAATKDCPDRYVCVWENAGYTGVMFHRILGAGGLHYHFGRWNDKGSSLVNKTGQDICWYEAADPHTGAVSGKHVHKSYYLDAWLMEPNDSMTAIGACV